MPPPNAPPLWLRWLTGVLLVGVGLPYAVFTERIRDWQIRRQQGRPYIIMLRVVGITMCLGGAGVLMAALWWQ